MLNQRAQLGSVGGAMRRYQQRVRAGWRTLPVKARGVIKLHCAALGSVVVAAALVANLGLHQGYDMVAFAVPAALQRRHATKLRRLQPAITE